MRRFLISIILLAFVFTPIANVVGFDGVGADHAYAAKKKMTQQTFTKQAAALSKQIKSYKSDQEDLAQQLDENRMSNAENFATLFEDETLGLSDQELLDYYIELVTKFADHESSLEDYFYQDEMDIISNYMYDIQATNSKISSLNAKINTYEADYKNLSKSKKYTEALKVRNNEIKAYEQLIAVLESGINLEYDFYSDSEDIFANLSYEDPAVDGTTDSTDPIDNGNTDSTDPVDDGTNSDSGDSNY